MELNAEELQRFGERVMNFITHYLVSLDQDPILPGDLDPQRLQGLFDEPLPRLPQGIDSTFQEFIEKIAANSVRVGHPRFLGWIRPSSLAAAVFAESLAAALNQSVAIWDGAPAATEVELRVLEWLKDISGFAPQAGGLLTSGGSVANLVCLLAARTAAGPQVREYGLAGQPAFTLYITQETHYSVLKAAEMMGIGRRNVRSIPVDAGLRMEPSALAEQIQADRQAGFQPLAVAATLGTVNSGACDDLLALGQVCQGQGVWLHIDGAYGGIAALVPEKRPLTAGLAQADSLAFDPHKSLFIPFEAGCALVRDPGFLRETFAMEADYLPNTEMDEPGKPGLPINFRDYGPQLSRSFRALKIYLALKVYGVDAFAAELSRLYSLAAQFADRVQSAGDLELLAPAPLGIVAFRYLNQPPGQRSNQAPWLDALNLHIATEVQRRGRAFLSSTRIHGKYALRACFVSFRTREDDLDVILDEVRSVGRAYAG